MATAPGNATPQRRGRAAKPNGNGHAAHDSAAAWAVHAWQWIDRGFYPVPLQPGSGVPTVKGWQNLRIQSDAEVMQYFAERAGSIGVLLGVPCGEHAGVMDVDLDSPEAQKLAAKLLPATEMVWGRRSNPASHHLYRATQCVPTAKYEDPGGKEGERRMLVELRGTANDGNVGYMARVPPSLHTSGEVVRFDTEGEPALIDASALCRGVALVAAGALLARHWPPGGN